jgi:uncharacterized protein (TIGR02646 family)
MRHVSRRTLSQRTQRTLDKLTKLVTSAPPGDRAAQAQKFWRTRTRNKAFDEIHEALTGMASGRQRCMYCEDSSGASIDHFWPMADFPERAFQWSNYLWACSVCNSNEKRAEFPMAGGAPLLVDPTKDEPRHHLKLLPTSGKLESRDGSLKGQPTIDTFHLNERDGRNDLPNGRRDAWLVFEALIVEYARLMQAGLIDEAGEIQELVKRCSFSAVLLYLIDAASGPASSEVKAECRAALVAHPEIRTWL